MTPKEKPLVMQQMEADFKKAVKGFEPEDLDRAFATTGISSTCRGETLTVAEFVGLTKVLIGQEEVVDA